MALPYSSASSGSNREKEIRDTLRAAGATAVGFMIDDDLDQIVAQFRMHGREVTIPVSVGNYAQAWLMENPLGPRARTKLSDHEAKARKQAELAAWAILADWIKATSAMITSGFLDVDTAFLPHIRLDDGRRVYDAMSSSNSPLRLPPPKG